MTSPRIHAILLTKNEADVIADCLRAALRWAHRVYVYDGASTDETWRIVRCLAEEDPRVIPWKQDGKVFSEGLRAEVFNAFRHQAREGDWWCQLNADEFFVDDPCAFLARIPRRHHVIWGILAQYYLTPEDVDTIDFGRPVSQVLPRIRYYEFVPTHEPRFFRHRDRLRWDPSSAWPRFLGVYARRRILVRHYPYRSPTQIQTRLDVRRDNRTRGFEGWEHACEEDWRAKLVSRRELTRDAGTTLEAPMDAPLPSILESPPRRLMKHALHGLRILP